MSAVPMIDAQRLSLMLNELRLPTIKHIWGDFAAQADKEGWPASRFLAALAEHELAERDRRRIERHLAEAHLPAGKTLDCFAFDAVPMISKAQVMAICAGDGLCCITPDRRKPMITCKYYATRTVFGVPICEKRLRIAARTLSSVI